MKRRNYFQAHPNKARRKKAKYAYDIKFLVTEARRIILAQQLRGYNVTSVIFPGAIVMTVDGIETKADRSDCSKTEKAGRRKI